MLLVCKIFIVIFVIFDMSPDAYSASFDCSKASTKLEQLICDDEDLDRMDTEMGKLYFGIRKELSDEGRDAIRKEQLSWIKERNTCKLDKNCLIGMYNRRIAEIANASQPISNGCEAIMFNSFQSITITGKVKDDTKCYDIVINTNSDENILEIKIESEFDNTVFNFLDVEVSEHFKNVIPTGNYKLNLFQLFCRSGCTRYESYTMNLSVQSDGDTKPASQEIDIDGLRRKASAQKGRTIYFKNFYIGMPIEDALQIINYSLNLQQVPVEAIDVNKLKPESREDNAFETELLKKMLQTMGTQVYGITDKNTPYRIWIDKGIKKISKTHIDKSFATADESGSVINFHLSPEVLQGLFGTGTMTTQDFLQSFVDAYDLTGLEYEQIPITSTFMGMTSQIGFSYVYRHRNPKGYEVIYYDETIIFEDTTLPFANIHENGTMIISQIETAQERKTRFD